MNGEKARVWRTIARIWADNPQEYKRMYRSMKKTYRNSKNPEEWLHMQITMAQHEFFAQKQRVYEEIKKEQARIDAEKDSQADEGKQEVNE